MEACNLCMNSELQSLEDTQVNFTAAVTNKKGNLTWNGMSVCCNDTKQLL